MNSEAILKFWIGTAALDSEAAKNRSKRWYTSSADDDEAMSVQFGATLKQAERGALADWQKTPQGRLALVILLDQMSRNIYRGTAQAYANDAHALDLASQMVDAGEHLQLTNIEQVFLFHPFEHAESLGRSNVQCNCLPNFSAGQLQTGTSNFSVFSILPLSIIISLQLTGAFLIAIVC
jgi:uncharacterized protein (DUF924 family)